MYYVLICVEILLQGFIMALKIRSNPMNPTQKIMLTEWMKQHPQLLSGQFSNGFTKKDARNLWETLTVSLNAIPGGCEKNWEQWRKVSK